MSKRLQSLLLILVPLLIFYPSFRYFFFQDDFLHLKRSWVEGPMAILGFFKPPSEAIFYRPLSLQIYFYLTRTLFGLNPLAFRIITFSFFLMSIILLKKVIKKITGDEVLSFTVALLFGISSIHFMSLFWICEFSVILGAFFLLLAFLFFPQKKSLLFFFLGLLSHELVMILPFLLLAKALVFKERKAKILAGFFLLGLAYFVFRFFLFPIPLKETYRLTLGKKNLSAFSWYFLWAFNLPEELKYQSVLSKLQIRQGFLKSFPKESLVWAGFLLFFMVSGLFSLKKSAWRKKKKIFLFGLIWFALGVLPLVFAPFHQYPMYLAFALPGFYLALLSWQGEKLRVLLFCFSLMSLNTIRFTEKTHWTVQEAKKAQAVFEKAKNTYPEVDEGTIFVLQSEPQLKAALADEIGLQVLYQKEVKTLYVNPQDFVKYSQRLEDFKILKPDEG